MERPPDAWPTKFSIGDCYCIYLGDLLTARVSLDEALRIHDPERDRDAKFRFGVDIGAVATVHLALAYWLLGRVDQAAELANEAAARAREIKRQVMLANETPKQSRKRVEREARERAFVERMSAQLDQLESKAAEILGGK